MDDQPAVLLDITPDGVATVTLNRPELHNAFNDEVLDRLLSILEDLGRQDGIRVLLLRGAGRSFSAGADLNWMRQAAGYTEEQNRSDAERLGEILRSLRDLPLPTVALVQGSALAGGVGLVAACDVAVAVSGVQFGLTEVKLGLIPAMISPHVIAAIGPRNAHRYFLTAERFDADEALRLGLVHEVVADHAGLEAARERLVHEFLAAAPGALADAKVLIGRVTGRRIDADLVAETARLIAERRVSAEGREGIGAFLEKRRPHWPSRR